HFKDLNSGCDGLGSRPARVALVTLIGRSLELAAVGFAAVLFLDPRGRPRGRFDGCAFGSGSPSPSPSDSKMKLSSASALSLAAALSLSSASALSLAAALSI
ncbi:hypothetical protein QBC46DRAFT_432042, partial [Diplogelasinospora grovesii]